MSSQSPQPQPDTLEPASSRRPVDDDITPTPVMEWGEFSAWFVRAWEQGEHITCIGTTGAGKTTMIKQFLNACRTYVVVFGVKGKDETMDKYLKEGYTRIKTWDMNEVSNRLVLWPQIRGHGHTGEQREEFATAMDSIYRQGGWCTVFDEVSYLSDTLNMDKQLKFFLQQGRSSGISVVGMTQRAAFIPLAFYDQADHLFVWKDNDRRNAQRIGELAGNARHIVQKEVGELRKRELLYLHKDSGFRVRTTVEV